MLPLSTPAKTVSRRTNPKSRSGCRICKSRKVKRPSCSDRLKRGSACSFDSSSIPAATTSLARETSHQSSSLGITDLKLLHHFTVSTCYTLSSEATVRDLWRVYIPQLGFSSEYVLHGLLSLAALHIGRFNSDRQNMYISQAMEHHNASFKAALSFLTNICPENSTALYMFSVLTFLFSLACPKKPDVCLTETGEIMPEWISLLRGIRSIMNKQGLTIRSSPLALICWKDTEYLPSEAESYENEHFKELEHSINVSSLKDARKKEALLLAINDLKQTFKRISHSSPETEDQAKQIFTWLYNVSDYYITLLNSGDGDALCIFGFFCILFIHLEHIWWAEGWAVYLIARVYSLVDDTRKLWLRWPVEEIGWVPVRSVW
ncbi:putative C6 transcription factor [Trichoderma evansii]